jgi:hypothetical protein
MKVPAKRITRGQEEDAFDEQECGIDPRDLAWRLNG